MSTWSYENQANPVWGAFDFPAWVDVGGDIRYVQYQNESETVSQNLEFLMQADVEAAVHIGKHVSFVTSGGTYGVEGKWSRRRYYMLLNTEFNHTLRFGKFFPAYGIMLDDHTRLNRRGLGFEQNTETLNFEVGLKNKLGEIFLTRVLGKQPSVTVDAQGIPRHKANGEEGTIIRLARYLDRHTNVGVSFLGFRNRANRRQAFGAYGLFGFTKRFYLLAQADRQFASGQMTDVIFSRLGFMAYKGLHLRGEVQYLQSAGFKQNVYGASVQWLPTPHIEFLYQYDLNYINSEQSTVSTLVLHYYF